MSGGGIAALEAWHASVPPEPALDPDLPIVDPHHHLWNRGGHDYRQAALRADFAGHRAETTVYVECRSHYRADGPEALRPVGETEFVVREAEAAGSAICSGIVAHADLALGDGVAAVLDAHAVAAKGRLRGIRYATAWDASDAIHASYPTAPAMLSDRAVRASLAAVARAGLVFDAWLFFPQMDELAAVADAHPDLVIVLDHLGGPIGIGPYAGRRAELFPLWRAALQRLAERPNVRVKLGGLGMAMMGFGFRKAGPPPASAVLAEAWRPYLETAIAAFGPERAMFESNFPVDLVSCRYGTLWNAFKRIAAGAGIDEKAALFAGTARATYRLRS